MDKLRKREMDKLSMQSEDGVKSNVEKIRELFPDVVAEVVRDGKQEHKVDFDALKQRLSSDLIDRGEEGYQFTWAGKQEAGSLADSPIKKTLRPVEKESVDFNNTQNLYIEGDNLEVLKLLQTTYLGKVKMIYIDPPYNTGNDFIFNDNFTQSKESYDEATGARDEEGNRLFQNSGSSGRYHSNWCSMIYSRLKLAKDLLRDDGVVFISIDDHEQAQLKLLCDEVFNERNFVGCIIWQSATDNNLRQISTEHEYVLCYARNVNHQGKWSIKSAKSELIEEKYLELRKLYSEPSAIQKKLREWIKKNEKALKGVAHYNNVDERGVYSSSSNSSNTKPGGYTFDIVHPLTKKACPKPAFGWRWPEETFWEYEKMGDVEWGEDETTQPHIKKRINTVVEQLKSIYYEDGRVATTDLETLFSEKKIFENPKPTNLIKRFISFASGPDDIVFDFFSGSATTAHAVMQLNAEDGGHRKFIMVQLPEKCKEESAAFKAGFKNICEIGKERIRRAGKKILEENPSVRGSLDTGFRVLKVDSSNMEDVSYTPSSTKQGELAIDNVKQDRTPLDLLFQVMLEFDKPLSSKIEETEIAGKKVFKVDGNDLICCFDENISDDVVKAIAMLKPERAVFRDSSFIDTSVRMNCDQFFAKFSNDTTCRVI